MSKQLAHRIVPEKPCVVIGAGAVGLAIAAKLSEKYPVLLIEKHESFGKETSSRNSEVIHAGIYYPKNSLKSKLCIHGNILLRQYLEEKNIARNICGKYIIATNEKECNALESIFDNAAQCGVPNLRKADKSEIKRNLPGIKAVDALFSPDTGVFDTHGFMESLESDAVRQGADLIFYHEVKSIEKSESGFTVSGHDTDKNNFSVEAGAVINAGGLDSDRLASIAGIDIEKEGYKLRYCRGHYYRLPFNEKYKFKHLIYPVPPKDNGLLGIHVTIDTAGGAKLGPDIEYLSENIQDYRIPPETKAEFFRSASRYIENLNETDLHPDTAGIRPRLAIAGTEFADFIISEESRFGLPGLINLAGIESPGLTSSLAIAEYVKSLLEEEDSLSLL